MKTLPLMILLCGAMLLSSCNSDPARGRILGLITKLDTAKADALVIQGLASQVRKEAAHWQAQENSARDALAAATQGLQDTQETLKQLNEEFIVMRDPNRLHLEQLAVGRKHEELTVGGQMYRDVEIKSFDGQHVSVIHRGGMARHAVPDYIAQAYLSSPGIRPPSKPVFAPRSLVIPALPRKPQPQTAAARAAQTARIKVPSWKGYAKSHGWPDWFVPVGYNLQGSSFSPLKKTKSH
jgi:hypothetical protein